MGRQRWWNRKVRRALDEGRADLEAEAEAATGAARPAAERRLRIWDRMIRQNDRGRRRGNRWGLGFWLVVILFVVAAVAWGLVFLILWPVRRLSLRA